MHDEVDVIRVRFRAFEFTGCCTPFAPSVTRSANLTIGSARASTTRCRPGPTWGPKAKRSAPVCTRLHCQANRLHVIHAPEKLYPSKEEARFLGTIARPQGTGIWQVQKSTKFGDPPHRQWWCLTESFQESVRHEPFEIVAQQRRAKQNMDYAYLMWCPCARTGDLASQPTEG